MAFGADVEGRGRIEGARRDQHSRHADQRVERRHQLRHRRHRNAPRDHGADAAAEGNAADHKSPGDGIGRRMRSQRGQRRNGHADHAELIAAPAGIRARQAAQRQDEQDAGDQIEQRDEIGLMQAPHAVERLQGQCGMAGCPIRACDMKNGHRHFFFFWYIASMRWVTRKPPKIFTEAKTSATKPSARAHKGP